MPIAVKKILERISDIQMTIIFGLFYLLILFPFALYVKLTLDPFGMKKKKSQWVDSNITSNTDNLLLQF